MLWLRARPRVRDLKLTPIWFAILAVVVVGMAVSGLAVLILWNVLNYPTEGTRGTEPALGTPEKLDIIRIALVTTAGLGGVVALVVAYRKQRVAEEDNRRASAAELRATEAERREETKLFNERFASATAQLGGNAAAVRLAGVFALAGLADDWLDQRQTCIDVLCAYLRMPYAMPAAPSGLSDGEREVRLSIIRVIRDHLRPSTRESWVGNDFDFTGARFDGGDLSGASFAGSTVSFDKAVFSENDFSFDDTTIRSTTVSFARAVFAGGTVSFLGARVDSGLLSFAGAEFHGALVKAEDLVCGPAGEISFARCGFITGELSLAGLDFDGGILSFDSSRFLGAHVDFAGARLGGHRVSFRGVKVADGVISFSSDPFSEATTAIDGATLDFAYANLSGGRIEFDRVVLQSGRVSFDGSYMAGTYVIFEDVTVLSGSLQLSNPRVYKTKFIFRNAERGEVVGISLPAGGVEYQSG